MSARDDLGKLLFTLPVSDRAADTAPEIMTLCDEAAEAILENGYRKPRTVTTRDEVLALHEGAVLLDSAGDVAQLRGGLWCGYEASPMSPARQAKYIPATVLHEGEARS